MRTIEILSMGLAHENFIFNNSNTYVDSLLNYKIEEMISIAGKTKNIIIFYNDDLLGLITYKIASILQTIRSMNIILCGKIKKTKKYFNQKFFPQCIKSVEEFKEDAIYVSSFNPIYYVKRNKKNFNFFHANNFIETIEEQRRNDAIFKLIDIFTPNQLDIILSYYFTEEQMGLNKKLFADFCETTRKFERYLTGLSIDETLSQNIKESKISKEKTFAIFNLTGKEENLKNLYEKGTDKNTICLYYIKDKNIAQNKFFASLRPQNIPNFYNLNNWDILNEIKRNYSYIEETGGKTDEDICS